MPRRFPIVQFPNPPLIAALTAAALARTAVDPTTARRLSLFSHAALLVWAYREVASGANWFRRLLGVIGAAYSSVALKRLTVGRTGRGS